MPTYYPVFLDIRGRKSVVIGGGEVAEGKLRLLLECGARVTVVSPEATPAVQARAQAGELRWEARSYRPGDLQGAAIAIAATDDPKVNRAIAQEAALERVLLNVVDQTALCTFIAPAVARRGPVTLAISTGGASPALARKLRESFEDGCASGCALAYADLADVLSDARAELKRRKANVNADRWQECIDEPLLSLAQRGQRQAALDLLLSRLLERVEAG